jgi:hypothetical protein
MQEFLSTVSPKDWYPIEKLKTCVTHIRKKDPQVLNKIGHTWAGRCLRALGNEIDLSPKEILLTGFSQYKLQHKGTVNEVGTIVCTEDPNNENKIIVSDYSIYRCDIIMHLFVGLIELSGGKNITCDHPDKMCSNKGFPYCRYEITWE